MPRLFRSLSPRSSVPAVEGTAAVPTQHRLAALDVTGFSETDVRELVAALRWTELAGASWDPVESRLGLMSSTGLVTASIIDGPADQVADMVHLEMTMVHAALGFSVAARHPAGVFPVAHLLFESMSWRFRLTAVPVLSV